MTTLRPVSNWQYLSVDLNFAFIIVNCIITCFKYMVTYAVHCIAMLKKYIEGLLT